MAGSAAAVVVIMIQLTQPALCDTQVRKVASMWRKEGHVQHVYTVPYAHDKEAVQALVAQARALGPLTPMIVVQGNTTALLCTDWNTWAARWVQADKWLWCTAIQPHGLQAVWHKDAVLQVWRQAGGAMPGTPLPCWGVLGATAGSLVNRLGRHCITACSLSAALGQEWLQGHLTADPTPNLAWTLQAPWQGLPSATDFWGPHPHLQEALPSWAPSSLPRTHLWLAACQQAVTHSTVVQSFLTGAVVLVAIIAILALVLTSLGNSRPAT